MTERSKVLAWKASEGLRPPQVRILSSPPIFTFPPYVWTGARNSRMWGVAVRHGMPFCVYWVLSIFRKDVFSVFVTKPYVFVQMYPKSILSESDTSVAYINIIQPGEDVYEYK